jgi:hypothetical protein
MLLEIPLQDAIKKGRWAFQSIELNVEGLFYRWQV